MCTRLFPHPPTFPHTQGIGLFPDVGGSVFLPRLPYAGLGMYLALTGYRLMGADNLHANFGTHYVESAKIPALEAALVKGGHAKVDSVLDTFVTAQEALPAFSLEPVLNRLAKTFTLGSVDDIIADLERDGDEWAQKQVKTLKRMSPTSLRLTHEQLTRGGRQDPVENFTMEARMVYGCMNLSGDFNEGVRALLLDKDKKPKWNPATLEEVCACTVLLEEEGERGDDDYVAAFLIRYHSTTPHTQATPQYMSRFFDPRPDGDWKPVSA